MSTKSEMFLFVSFLPSFFFSSTLQRRKATGRHTPTTQKTSAAPCPDGKKKASRIRSEPLVEASVLAVSIRSDRRPERVLFSYSPEVGLSPLQGRNANRRRVAARSHRNPRSPPGKGTSFLFPSEGGPGAGRTNGLLALDGERSSHRGETRPAARAKTRVRREAAWKVGGCFCAFCGASLPPISPPRSAAARGKQDGPHRRRTFPSAPLLCCPKLLRPHVFFFAGKARA